RRSARPAARSRTTTRSPIWRSISASRWRASSRPSTEPVPSAVSSMTALPPVCARLLAMPAALAAQGFALRPESEADLPFLRRLYVSTRWEELAIVTDWSDAQKQAFLERQFRLQRHHYLTYYAATDCAVLEQDGAPAGRLY